PSWGKSRHAPTRAAKACPTPADVHPPTYIGSPCFRGPRWCMTGLASRRPRKHGTHYAAAQEALEAEPAIFRCSETLFGSRLVQGAQPLPRGVGNALRLRPCFLPDLVLLLQVPLHLLLVGQVEGDGPVHLFEAERRVLLP